VEAMPDPFIRYEYPKLVDESRQAVADLLSAPVETVVFVPNATNGLNTVLRNLQWARDGMDEILYFSTIYGACGKTVDYIVDSCYGLVSSRRIDLSYPCEDDAIIARFQAAVQDSKQEGKRPRICIYDMVSSLPGVRFPFEAMTKTCKQLGVISVIDGAQGVGMIDINLAELDPDYFFSNCHKWLHVPRGCAVFYVPARNQNLMVSTLPTSHGYVSKAASKSTPPGGKTAFSSNFEYTGTLDNSPYLCVKDSIQWRRETLGGEKKIYEYLVTLARKGGETVARILGTTVLDNRAHTATNCAMVNVRLPLTIRDASNQDETVSLRDHQDGPAERVVQSKDVDRASQWMMKTLVDEHRTFIVVYAHGQHLWTRLSAQIYLEVGDFEWAGRILLGLCERVGRKEYDGGNDESSDY
jgi:selenocysteine lyase/cysteine desulfurase